MPRPGRSPTFPALVAVALLLLLTLPALAPSARAASYPTLPEPGREFLSNLSVPSIDPGATTHLAFELTDPTNLTLTGLVLSFGLYAFNGFPGDAVSPTPVAHAPTLATANVSGPSVSFSLSSLRTGSSDHGTITVASSSSTPSGTFAIRTALSFEAGGKSYRFESRGWFGAALWANATRGPNGSATVNLTMLNVSGILPETAVLVKVSSWPYVLGALLVGGLVLVGLAAWLYFRRTDGSSSGAG